MNFLRNFGMKNNHISKWDIHFWEEKTCTIFPLLSNTITGPLIYWYLTFHPVKNNSLHWKLWFSDMIAAGLRMSNISVTYLLFIFQRIISVLISVACVCHAVFSLAVVVQLISIQLLFLDRLDQLFSKQGPEAPRVLKEGCRRPPWEWGII